MQNTICRVFSRVLFLALPALLLAACATTATTDVTTAPIKYYFSPHYGELFSASRKMTPEEAAATSAAAQQGDAAAQYRMALALLGRDNPDRGDKTKEAAAFAWMQKSAQQGYPDAQVYLGTMYRNGQGVETSREKAVEWYKKAIQAGNPHAIFEMGSLSYERRWGRNIPNTLEYFHKAAEAGDVMAQVALSFFLLEGQYVPKDAVQGEAWLKKATDTGDALAQYAQGSLYLKGRHFPKDMDKAAEWFKKSAAQNYLPAIGALKSLERRKAQKEFGCGDNPSTKTPAAPPAAE